MNPQVTTNGASSAAVYERGAQRLHDAIATSCDPREPFAERVQAALRAALALLAADPTLARLLTVEPCLGSELVIRRHQRWQKRYGALLRRAAAESPEASSHPSFLEPALIGGLRFQVARPRPRRPDGGAGGAASWLLGVPPRLLLGPQVGGLSTSAPAQVACAATDSSQRLSLSVPGRGHLPETCPSLAFADRLKFGTRRRPLQAR